MYVQLLKLDQSVSLEDTTTSFSIVLQLPNGQLVRASLDNEATQAILEAQVADTPLSQDEDVPPQSPPPPPPTPPPQPVPQAPTFNHQTQPTVQPQQPPQPVETTTALAGVAEDEEMVVWRELSDDILTSRMKSILTAVGLSEEVSVGELKRTVEKIVSKLPKQQPDPPQHALQGNGAKAPARTVVPGVGQVVWKDGPVVIQKPPIRTVPMTAMGYPIVQGNSDTRDPGEVVGRGDLDEDGVGQL